ncbi:MAG TPA: tryptophan-rich sensory protein [Candidatus Paceibacterota bacterium]|nr:tryptophan-rich sensory protein [Candidatus Paceibacterota bacterium]
MKTKNILTLAGALLIPQIIGLTGALFTSASIPTWYATLTRPELAPPNWVFGPVWTLLFILMGIASFLIFQKGYERRDVRIALSLYGAQLILNLLWSLLFFGARNPGLAFAEIVVLWLVLFLTIKKFWPLSKTSAYLLVPYILWVSFAGYLNYSIWILN